MTITRGGMGDWFTPDCTPGTADCVPHWYCYIPGMATPDCLQSLQVGLEQIGSDVGSAVGGVVGATVSGAGSAAASTATSLASFPVIWIVGGIAALYFLGPMLMQRGGRRR